MSTTNRSPTRRSFVRATAGGAAVLLANDMFGNPAQANAKPNPKLVALGAVALTEAKKQGASYADVRIGRYRNQLSGYRLSPERANGDLPPRRL